MSKANFLNNSSKQPIRGWMCIHINRLKINCQIKYNFFYYIICVGMCRIPVHSFTTLKVTMFMN